jgi:Phosphoesterase family/Carboxypeptidase regulatory-like domain
MASDASPSAAGFPTPIQHVFTIVLENAGLSEVLSDGTYLDTLYTSYAGASNYYAVCHPSAPNYLAMTSGELLQCGTDNVNSYSVGNIASLVSSAGETWTAYMESMPTACDTHWYPSTHGLYKPGHDPFVYYSDLTEGGSSSACESHVLPLSSFNPADTPANYTFITPNMLNDGHNTSVAYASNWLSTYLPPLLAEPWAASTVFFIVYDEGAASDSSGYDGLDGGHTYLAAVSPYTLGSGLYTADASPYSLLTTTEWLLGLTSMGYNDNWTKFPPMKSMFQVSTGPSEYVLTGQVDEESSGLPIVGATVSIPGIASTSTNSTGVYSLTLQNGTYSVTASAAGFDSATASISVKGKIVHHTFELYPVGQAQYALSGLVTSASQGSGLADAIVTVADVGSTSTGSNGSYSVELFNGTYNVTAGAPGFQTSAAEVTIAGSPVDLDFQLVAYPAGSNYSLSGEVVYAANSTGVVGATVTLTGGPPETAGTNGSYLFVVPNGTYGLTIVQPGFYAQQAVVVVLGASQTNNFDLYPFLLQIQGEVLSQTNKTPIVGANVSLSPTIWQLTGLGGAYDFWVPNGSYLLRVDYEGYLSASVPLALHGKAVTKDLSLTSGTPPTTTGISPSGGHREVPYDPWIIAAVGTAAVCFSTLIGLFWRWSTRRPRLR